MSAPAGDGAVEEALALRAWALRLLGGQPAPPPRAGEAAWKAFLFAERCALPLRGRAGATVPAETGGVLEARATLELQRAMAARAVLAELARMVRGHGLRALVLKGGVPLAEGGEMVDVSDVDLLLPAADAAALAAAMDRSGWSPHYADPVPGTPGCFHLAARSRPGYVSVELHYALAFLGGGFDPWEGARPSAVPGLMRMAPRAQAWHVLAHAVVHHPPRRGSIRDLLVLAQALRECTPDDLVALEARAAASVHAAPMAGALAMARALAEGRAPDDAFAAVAAIVYLLVSGASRVPHDGRFGGALVAAATGFVAGGGEYRRLWAGGPTAVLTPEAFQGGYGIDRWAPGAARALRKLQRGGVLAAASVPGWMLARRAARLAERAEQAAAGN